MTFKQNWEKTDLALKLPYETIEAMLKQFLPTKTMYSCECIVGGCANLNYKIYVDIDENPYILRLYLRDFKAAYREQQLSLLLKDKKTIPIPEVYFIGHYQNYQFAFNQYLSGITLRDLLLSDQAFDIKQLMFDTGVLANQIHTYTFRQGGFFDNKLQPLPLTTTYLEYALNCLNKDYIITLLGQSNTARLTYYFQQLESFFPSLDEKQLVHGDFDPANILVNYQEGRWQISGVLDWEFAFSGSPLFDVANMLRYAHHLPSHFQDAFLKGLTLSYTLPPHWQTTIYLLNLLSLLDCLSRSSAKRPNQQADIYELIIYFMQQLTKEHGL
ncbi:phosphotransferase family protein [Legionella sp. D16C41]|uniref:phosphotransferase family protein n=1 Tax=Legionella sp. D16C41 TaxID=3402688 RepID=UPI003AF51D79